MKLCRPRSKSFDEQGNLSSIAACPAPALTRKASKLSRSNTVKHSALYIDSRRHGAFKRFLILAFLTLHVFPCTIIAECFPYIRYAIRLKSNRLTEKLKFRTLFDF